ncbi:hypothetical protein E3P99_03678 [Wallemia hederae]|uniref:Structural maintenance of chromosomes protein 5 n=1 Tax=Wallemia hederae TaxID=1540922 RepID=A0A4T0FE24_9BASI|nr:hypothetical protein E3P99_03678 [Wallemia hederae]
MSTTNLSNPRTAATLTIRLIKSFEYRTTKNLILKGVDLTQTTVMQLVEMCKKEVQSQPRYKAFRNVEFDCIKLYTQAHFHKTTNLIINIDNEHWIIGDWDTLLADIVIDGHQIENETELSLFNKQAYDTFLQNPETKRVAPRLPPPQIAQMPKRSLKRQIASSDDEDAASPKKQQLHNSEEEDDAGAESKPTQSQLNGDDDEKEDEDGEGGDGDDGDDDNDDQGPDPAADNPLMDHEDVLEALQPQERQRDRDNFIPGSIVRVVLHNFLTYDHVDFCPGPYLNMIIGPNGTGKSTIVCGIALGLGAGPKILGRSSDVNAFVKQDKDQGYIQIHLKARDGLRNHVIKRSINSTDKQSKYEVDGEISKLEVIKDIVQSYGIQIGNLCSFLPQDKVSQFAQMSPSTLLTETQKVAEGTGIGDLSAWHDQLKESGKELSQKEYNLNSVIKDRDNLQEMNRSQEREIERFRARKAIEKKINLLNLMIPFARYSHSKAQYDAAKANRKRLNEHVIEIERENLPLKKKITEYSNMMKNLENQRREKEETIEEKRRDLKEVGKQLELFHKHTEDATTKIDESDRADERRALQIEKVKTIIADLEQVVANPPSDEGLAELDAQIQTIKGKIAELHEEGKRFQDVRRDVASEQSDLQHEMARYQKSLSMMDNVKHRRFEKFRSFDETTARTVDIIGKNADKFGSKVYDPAFLEVRVKEPSYANAIESLISAGVLKTILCQTQEDYDIATKQIIDKYHFRVNIVQPVFQARDLEETISREEIREMGFDGFAIDFIDAPQFILDYLKKSSFLHRIPVARSADQVNMRAVEESRAFRNKQLRRYIIGSESHTTQWSRYGRQAANSMTSFIKPARIFNDATTDTEERQGLEARVEECRSKLNELETRVSEMIPQEKELRSKERDYKQEIGKVDDEKKKIQKKQQEHFKAQTTLNHNKKSLQQLVAQPTAQLEKEKLRRLICKITRQRVAEVDTYTELVKDVAGLIDESELLVLEELQYDVNKRSLNQFMNEYSDRLSAASRELGQANAVYKQVKQDSTTYLKEAQRLLAAVDPELREDFMRFRERVGQTGDDQSLEELEDALAVEKSNLEMNSNISSGVVEAYEKREKIIAGQNKDIEKRQRDYDKKKAYIDRIKSQWEPTLLKLIAAVSERFSRAFQRFGCAGEVKLFRHPTDYEQWAIEIYVKFRETESLELLTHQRQSGGERSLSTILYLMSLTELSKSPFSLVDEINQGMDSRAERLVHNQMVQVTCQDYSSQYFLITPKLLPNLTYHPKMKVLCINNGEWLDERRGNLALLLKDHRKAGMRSGLASQSRAQSRLQSQQVDVKPDINVKAEAVL